MMNWLLLCFFYLHLKNNEADKVCEEVCEALICMSVPPGCTKQRWGLHCTLNPVYHRGRPAHWHWTLSHLKEGNGHSTSVKLLHHKDSQRRKRPQNGTTDQVPSWQLISNWYLATYQLNKKLWPRRYMQKSIGNLSNSARQKHKRTQPPD